MHSPASGWQTRPMEEPAKGCVLFADVSGSTRLYESVGDAAAHSAIDLCVKFFRAITEQHNGRVIKTIGDEVMAIFAHTGDAGRAAVDMQLGVNDMAPVEIGRASCRERVYSSV